MFILFNLGRWHLSGIMDIAVYKVIIVEEWITYSPLTVFYMTLTRWLTAKRKRLDLWSNVFSGTNIKGGQLWWWIGFELWPLLRDYFHGFQWFGKLFFIAFIYLETVLKCSFKKKSVWCGGLEAFSLVPNKCYRS